MDREQHVRRHRRDAREEEREHTLAVCPLPPLRSPHLVERLPSETGRVKLRPHSVNPSPNRVIPRYVRTAVERFGKATDALLEERDPLVDRGHAGTVCDLPAAVEVAARQGVV